MSAKTAKASKALYAALAKKCPVFDTNPEDGFVCIPIDRRKDLWAFYPVSATRGGITEQIHDQGAGPRPVSRAERRGMMGFRVKGRAPLDDVYALCWRPFEGLAAARAAMAAVLGVSDEFTPGAHQ